MIDPRAGLVMLFAAALVLSMLPLISRGKR